MERSCLVIPNQGFEIQPLDKQVRTSRAGDSHEASPDPPLYCLVHQPFPPRSPSGEPINIFPSIHLPVPPPPSAKVPSP